MTGVQTCALPIYHLVDLRGRRNRHDARDDGDRHAEGAGPVPEAAENVVVEKELTDQGVHAQVRLLLQAAQVLLEARGLQVLLRVAGGEDAETPAFPDEGDQIRGVPELPELGGLLQVAPQDQDVADVVRLKLVQNAGDVLLRAPDAGQMGQPADVVPVLDGRGDVQRVVSAGPARAVGDADQVGGQAGQGIHRGVGPRQVGRTLGGKNLERVAGSRQLEKVLHDGRSSLPKKSMKKTALQTRRSIA